MQSSDATSSSCSGAGAAHAGVAPSPHRDDHGRVRPTASSRRAAAPPPPAVVMRPQSGLIKAKTADADGVTLALMVLPAVHRSKAMSLRYFFEGAMPSEATEAKLDVGQVVEFGGVAALESDESGIEAFITEDSTLRVLKQKEASTFFLGLVAD